MCHRSEVILSYASPFIVVELDRASLYRYPGNYMRYLELKAERLAAEDAETNRARTKLRRESEWMAKQPRARQAKSKARQDQFYELVQYICWKVNYEISFGIYHILITFHS